MNEERGMSVYEQDMCHYLHGIERLKTDTKYLQPLILYGGAALKNDTTVYNITTLALEHFRKPLNIPCKAKAIFGQHPEPQLTSLGPNLSVLA